MDRTTLRSVEITIHDHLLLVFQQNLVMPIRIANTSVNHISLRSKPYVLEQQKAIQGEALLPREMGIPHQPLAPCALPRGLSLLSEQRLPAAEPRQNQLFEKQRQPPPGSCRFVVWTLTAQSVERRGEQASPGALRMATGFSAAPQGRSA